MGKFDLENYVPVEERLKEFHNTYPKGRVTSRLEHIDPSEEKLRMVIISAAIYADDNPASPPLATGIAKEREGTLLVNKTSFVENCETSAIGRALANAGFLVDKRPSRQEMEAVEKAELQHRMVLSQIKTIAQEAPEEIKNKVRRNWEEAKSDYLVAQKLLAELDSIEIGE